MREAIRKNPQRTPKALTMQIPAPVKGWASMESQVGAKPDTALVLDNFYPQAEGLKIRGGYTVFASGLGGEVQSLMTYTSATSSKFIAAANGGLYEVNFEGVTPSASVSGLSGNKWQHCMFATPAGQFLYCVNGIDSARYFDGTNWTIPTITGVSSDTLINIIAHKYRLWFAQAGTTDLWYLPVNSISGEAVAFPIGALFNQGGYIEALGVYSYDAGYGMDDLFFAWSSEGEIAVFQGTDPDSAATWGLVGVFRIGKPLGRRAVKQIAGDSALLTEDGIMPFSKVMKLDRSVVSKEAITANIRQAFSDAVQRSREAFGWQLTVHPIRNMAIANIPAGGSEDTCQFVMNTTTGAWCRFTNMDAVCWGTYDNMVFFGGTDGKVYRADYGGTDNGEIISSAVLPAFNDLKSGGRLLHVKLCRPIFTSDIATANPAVSIASDYKIGTASSATDTIRGNFFTWDVSLWDGTDVWFGFQYRNDWLGNGGIGSVISPYTTFGVDTSDGATFFTWDVSLWDGEDRWRGFVSSFNVQLTGWGLVYEVGGVM